MNRGAILIVEDEAIVAADLAVKLGHLGYTVTGCTGRGEEAIAMARDSRPDMVLMDIQLQGRMDGLETAATLHRDFGLPFIYLTAHSDTATIQRAKVTDAFGYILKPFEERELETAIEMALFKHQSAARLKESEERCRALADASFDGVLVLEQSTILDVNSRFLAMLGLGRDEAVGKQVRDVVGLELDSVATPPSLSGDESEQISLIRNDGERLFVELRVRSASFQGRPVQVASIRDVTEAKRMEDTRLKLEAQLRHSQKIQALGTLAAGIAHDFNNILTTIIGNAELAEMELPPDHPCRELLAHVLKSGCRARDLVDQILTFSSPREQNHGIVELGSAVEEALDLLRASLPSTIDFRNEVPLTGCAVLGDPVRIQQALINLGSNALHAMKNTGGVLRVRQSLMTVEEDGEPGLDLLPGRYVRLEVSDTGCGMAPATLERIFEPFFTTRRPGEGTGLGLAVALGIMQSHGGTIRVNSELGKGAAFHLFFPAAASNAKEAAAKPAPKPGGGGGRGERVMVVDDEPDVAELAGLILKRGGYGVAVYTNPLDALAALQESPDAYDLVLTDLTMPGMTGQELAAAILRIRPRMPVVLCTGLGHDLGVNLNGTGIQAKISKPFSIQGLHEVLDRVLLHER